MQFKAKLSWIFYSHLPSYVQILKDEGLNRAFFFRFSGVTEESLHGVTTTIHEVQAVLLSMIHKDTILVGHSLESDLKATKVSFQGTI